MDGFGGLPKQAPPKLPVIGKKQPALPAAKSKVMFNDNDDSDDDFKMPVAAPKALPNFAKPASSKVPAANLFAEDSDEDIIPVKRARPPSIVMSKPLPVIQKKPALLDDDDDDEDFTIKKAPVKSTPVAPAPVQVAKPLPVIPSGPKPLPTLPVAPPKMKMPEPVAAPKMQMPEPVIAPPVEIMETRQSIYERGGSIVQEKQLTVAEIQAKTNLAALIGAGKPVKRKTETKRADPPLVVIKAEVEDELEAFLRQSKPPVIERNHPARQTVDELE